MWTAMEEEDRRKLSSMTNLARKGDAGVDSMIPITCMHLKVTLGIE